MSGFLLFLIDPLSDMENTASKASEPGAAAGAAGGASSVADSWADSEDTEAEDVAAKTVRGVNK